jgi:hypothetical protein
MNDEQMRPLLKAWFQARKAAPTDVPNGVAQVLARVPEVRQRGRWWPLPTFDRPAPIPATGGPMPARGFSMSSAVKFVVAAAIVALFGGFLLTGVLTTQQGDEMAPAAVTASPTAKTRSPVTTQPPESPPSPMTTDELLSGMVTDEVEPGILRVVSDGVRDLPVDARDGGSTWSVNVGYDGSVWLFTGDDSNSVYHDRAERFLRLGSDESHQWPEASFWGHAFEVAPDGTMWVVPFPPSDGRRSTDGEEWTVQTCPQGRHCRGFTVAPDGTVWASWREDDGRWRVGHLGPTGWQPLDGYAHNVIPPFRGWERLIVADAGHIYGYEADGLFRYEDGDWKHLPGVDGLIDVGRDGTLWHDSGNGLNRFVDGEWTRWTSADLPDIRFGVALGHEPEVHDHEFKVAPDGSLWFGLWQQGADGNDPSLCDGLARFDGVTLDRFLRGRCTSSMDIAPDGSVWLRSSDDPYTTDLYVITPEALAAGE